MFEEFKNWLQVNGLSENTIKKYLDNIKNISKLTDINTLDEKKVEQLLLQMKEKYSPTNVNNHRYTLKTYLRFIKKEIKFPRPLKIIRTLPNTITLEYLEKNIIPMVEILFQNPLKIKTVFYFMFFTGVRVGELKYLKRKDIDLKDKSVKIYGEKTKTERTVLFDKKTKKLLELYFSIEPETKNAFNITKSGINRWIRDLKPYFTDVNLHVHIFRHSMATHLINKGVRVEFLQRLLGHKNIETTMKYAQANINAIKEEYHKNI